MDESANTTTSVEKKESVDQPHVTVDDAEQKEEAPAVTATIGEEMFQGTVALWKRTHGFLVYNNKNEESKRIFCHKSAVKTDDKRVLLRRGMAVEFRVETHSDGKINAVEVQGVGGGPLNFHMKHGEEDTFDRELTHDGEVFTGQVKFFSRFRGYGRITSSEESVKRFEELKVSEEDMPEFKEVYFKEIDLDCEDFPANIERGTKLSFKIFTSCRGFGATNIQTADGKVIPALSMEEREAQREQRKAEKKEASAEKKKKAKPEKKKQEKREKKGKKKQERRPRRNRRESKQEKKEKKKEFKEINEEERFEGTVIAYSVHRFGFIKMNTGEERKAICEYGNLKNEKLCFRVQDIVTEQRPPMIDSKTAVKFSIRRKGDILYAVNIRDAEENPIQCETAYEPPKEKELLEETWFEGEVKFYNWRRGHGRVIINGGEDQFYFHRNDLRSKDKVPGVSAGAKVMCQKVNDPKGAAVSNICNLDKTPLENQAPMYMKKGAGPENTADEN